MNRKIVRIASTRRSMRWKNGGGEAGDAHRCVTGVGVRERIMEKDDVKAIMGENNEGGR